MVPLFLFNIKYIYKKSNEINSFYRKDILENIKSIIKGEKRCEEKGTMAAATAVLCCYQACGGGTGGEKEVSIRAAVRFGEDDRCGTPERYADRDMLSGTQTDPDGPQQPSVVRTADSISFFIPACGKRIP